MTVQRKVARLAPENYFGRQSYFLTICCDHRAPYLREKSVAQCVMAILFECAAGQCFQLHAFCLMVDHIHILAEGADERCDVREFVRLFKQRTGFEFRKIQRQEEKNGSEDPPLQGPPLRPRRADEDAAVRLWEMSYYDYVLRPADRVEDVACYIWWNPVRQGLCSYPREFPYSGSQTLDWMKRSTPVTSWRPPW